MKYMGNIYIYPAPLCEEPTLQHNSMLSSDFFKNSMLIAFTKKYLWIF